MSGSQSVVCEEVFDDRSQPSDAEVREFAAQIGIDPDQEPHLIHLARDGLMKPLPKNWKPIYDHEQQRFYYFNFKTKKSTWEHPLDNRYRQLVKKSRSESISSAGDDDSKTSLKEELKSFEEAGGPSVLESDLPEEVMESLSRRNRPSSAVGLRGSLPLDLGLSSLGSSSIRSDQKSDQLQLLSRRLQNMPDLSRKSDGKIELAPKVVSSLSFKRNTMAKSASKQEWNEDSFSFDEDSDLMKPLKSKYDSESLLSKSKDKTFGFTERGSTSSVIGRFTVDKVHKIDIDQRLKRLDSERKDEAGYVSERAFRIGHGRSELTLSGGGSVFLKSNKVKTEQPPATVTQELIGNYDGEEFGSIHNVTDLDSLKRPSSQQSILKSNLESTVLATDSPSALATRSILRTPQGDRPLWDIDPQHMSSTEKALWKQQELEEEKKSVRFNLDKELKISFKLSDSSLEESVSDVNAKDIEEKIELESDDSSNDDVFMQNFTVKGEKDKAPGTLLRKVTKFGEKERSFNQSEEWSEKQRFSDEGSIDFALQTSQVQRDTVKMPGNAGVVAPTTNSHFKATGSRFETPKSSTETRMAFLNTTESLTNYKDEDKKELSEPLSRIKDASYFTTSNSQQEQKLSVISDDIIKLVDDDNLEKLEVSSTGNVHKKGKEPDYKEDLPSKQAQAREQALMDWQVKPGDPDKTCRAPLSRQQSQLQFQQLAKENKPTKVAERDRALRDWSVIQGGGKGEPIGTLVSAQEEIDLGRAESESPRMGSGTECNVLKDAEDSLSSAVTKRDNVSKEETSHPLSGNMSTNAIHHFEEEYVSKLRELELEYKENLERKKAEYRLLLEQEEQQLMKKIENDQHERQERAEKKALEQSVRLERESETGLQKLKEQLEHKQKCALQELQEHHQQALAAQEVENQAAMLRVREQHAADMRTLREQLLREEEQVRREHSERLANIREGDGRRSKEMIEQIRAVEKLRCEKRLVDDKYRTLKEKYVKLKGEVKASRERGDHKGKAEVSEQRDQKRKPDLPVQASNEQESSVSQTQSQLPMDRSSGSESKMRTASTTVTSTSSALGFHQSQPLMGKSSQKCNPNWSHIDSPSPAPDNNNFSVTGKQNRNVNNTNTCETDGKINEHVKTINQLSLTQDDHSKNNNDNGHITSHPIRNNNKGTDPSPSTISPHIHCNEELRKEKLRTEQCTPLDALRGQLRTLDELEEQFPASSLTDTYLRYPFPDSGDPVLGSAELEFFRHRIHLERDMVHQAKSSLRAQQNEYQLRLHNFKQRQLSTLQSSPSSTLQRMSQEEHELSDMEASLQRTRSLLSEKIIRLRHLENSLHQVTSPKGQTSISNGVQSSVYAGGLGARWAEKVLDVKGKPRRRWDWKTGTGHLGVEDISDELSSDSGGSSGFSSTDGASDNAFASLLKKSGRTERFKAPEGDLLDINTSLHNLNSEISEIWNVLCRQRTAAGLGPPPLLSSQPAPVFNSTPLPTYHDIAPVISGHTSSPVTHSQPVVSNNASLIERTNNLREWLHKAKISASVSHGDQSAKQMSL